MDGNNTEVAQVYSYEEALLTQQQLNVMNPQEEYTIVEKQHSYIKAGFGRDPDLH
tara:strand:- start:6342 stop:6506 length:165 start_codon:yes stop_codon:yes gene_type:complete